LNNLHLFAIKRSLGAHACNPHYSGGRDQEDCVSKPDQVNSSCDPISKTSSHTKKKTGRVAQGLDPEFKPPYCKKKKKKKNRKKEKKYE
jgi:hypothetical protein